MIVLFAAILLISTAQLSAVSETQTKTTEEKSLTFERAKKTDFNVDSSQGAILSNVDSIYKRNTVDIPSFDGIMPAVSHSGSTMVGASLDLNNENVYYWASTDNGETWTGGLGWEMNDIPELPSVDGCGDGRYIASFVTSPYEDDGSGTFKTTIGDANDLENTFDGLYWTWNDVGAGYTNFIDVEVAGYTAADATENEWAYGAFAMVGDHGELGSQSGFFSYQYSEDGMAWIYTLANNPGDFNGATSCGIDIDHATNFGYAVYNYDNGGTKDLYIFIMNFDEWGDYEGRAIHDDTYEAYINSSGNDNVVDISALNENIIIISEREGSIVAYYSNDDLSTVNEVEIDANGAQPRIVHTSDQSAVCSFVKNGVVYTSYTEDGGVTWSTPIENSEESFIGSADICAFGALYDSEETVFFAPIQVSMPIIEIDSISGGLGVTAVVKNTGTADAEDIEYSIVATGGLLGFVNSEASGTISVPAGGDATINLPMFIGLGSVVITVNAGLASSEISATQLLVLTKI